MKTNKLLFLALAAVPAAALAQSVQPLALQAAQDYAQQARYPAWSQVLELGAVDPLVDARTPTRQSRLGPNGASPRLTVWPSTISALPGEAVTLYASLTRSGAASRSLLEAAPSSGSAVTGVPVHGEVVARSLGALGRVTYRDDGKAPDQIANDGVYTASYVLPTATAPALGTADSVMVTVTAELAENDLRKAATGFQFSNPAARLTGRYTDAVKNGDLVIAAEVEVVKAGRVHVSGTLADAAGLPFVTAQAAQELAPGKHWLELPFYGLAFHDRGVTGAVTLATVALSSTGSMPNALGPMLSAAHTTKAYNLAQFTALPFNDADALEMAKRLQRDAAPAVR